jgi:hypothetical protein
MGTFSFSWLSGAVGDEQSSRKGECPLFPVGYA